MTNHDTQKFIDLRQKIIQKQQALNKIGLPKTNFSKTELRTGLMGRVQRREQKRFLGEIKKKKMILEKQKRAIDRYLSRVDSIPSPRITLMKTVPKMKIVRRRAIKQIRRRKKR